ncbi:MAG: hypothetical protein JWM21_1583 [Acidobacteria bacterium]|nr:hypothetical protein [Acidobacteriota bacterium]
MVASLVPALGGPRTCEACGKDFTCGASLAGCWCTELKLSDEARADLRSRYQNCLCRECLEKLGPDSQD